MSKQFDDSNRGSIWPNKRKEKDTHPDFTGQINVDGKDYWLNGWRRKEGAREGSPSMTFTVRPKDGQSPRKSQASERRPQREEMDDEIPF